MKTAVLVALFALAAIVAGQSTGTFQRFAIDDFKSGVNNLFITIPQNPSFPIEQVSIYTDSGNPAGLLGGERDLKLAAESGPAGRLLTSQVADGEWSVSTPNGASGFANIQYDGKDNSFNLDNNGLGGIDFTDGGLAEAFTAIIEADVATEYTFTVTSSNGNQCTRTQTIPGTQVEASYYIPFSSFTGNCDFEDVGAIDIFIEQFANVDSLITLFAVVGDPDPTPSHSPSPTGNPQSLSNTPSSTRTPTQAPTQSHTRTPTATPSTLCMCHCPAFTCELIFDPDDDENNVYYFDDDDHNPFGDPDPSSGGAITDSLDPKSGASVLEVSFAIFFAIVIAMF